MSFPHTTVLVRVLLLLYISDYIITTAQYHIDIIEYCGWHSASSLSLFRRNIISYLHGRHWLL